MWKVSARECFNSEPYDLYCEEIDLSDPQYIVLKGTFVLVKFEDQDVNPGYQRQFSELDPIYYNPQLVIYMGEIKETLGLKVVKE